MGHFITSAVYDDKTILLFPEGTDRGERAVRLSDEFAKEHGLPIYNFVLHPRTTGFTYMMRLMRESKCLIFINFAGVLRVLLLKLDEATDEFFPSMYGN
ncbi:unnamed protein product [Gongylonema pulchrum]|uniref:PlsC domain-containing protein n=1 Tax=Gongylonema pulchrum TaxID=637853 RepID=A0A183EU65_9BILA|nr:unnamed protein product [Gongylonema pulchrum]